MESHVTEIQSILNGGKGEREIHAYLKSHPRLVAEAFCPRHATARVVSEFELGNEFRADFMAGVPMSGGWFISLIELESVDAALFTKDGVPAKSLNHAMTQLLDWRRYEDRQKGYLIEQIARAFRERDLYIPDREDPEPYCSAGLRMSDPNCIIGILHKIMIGRRHDLTEEQLSRKVSLSKRSGIEIRTYDHLLESARYFRDDF